MANTCDRKMDRKVVMIDHRLQVTKGGGAGRRGSWMGVGEVEGLEVLMLQNGCSGMLGHASWMERRLHRVLTSDFKEAGSEIC